MQIPTAIDRKSRMTLVALLFSRLLLFALIQAGIAALLNSWDESVKYWILSATITNLISIFLLKKLLQREGIEYLSLFRFFPESWKKDILVFLGLAIITVPLVLIPNFYLNLLIYGDSDYYSKVMFQAIPELLIYFLLIGFPVTIAFAELATYFGYLMPRLKTNFKSHWFAVLLPAIFLSVQHCTLPLVFQLDFVFFRGMVYFPFAFFIGICLYIRPSLLPYFAIFHGLLDAGTVLMLLNEIN